MKEFSRKASTVGKAGNSCQVSGGALLYSHLGALPLSGNNEKERYGQTVALDLCWFLLSLLIYSYITPISVRNSGLLCCLSQQSLLCIRI